MSLLTLRDFLPNILSRIGSLFFGQSASSSNGASAGGGSSSGPVSGGSAAASEPTYDLNDYTYLYQMFMRDAHQLQEDNQAAQAEQNRLEREFQSQSAAEADQRWKENLQASTDAQRMLRQTQYQDYVDSLKAAGLNPMLAVTSGVPSTPSVNSASHAASGGNSNVGIDIDSVSDYYNTLVSSAFDLTKGVANTVGNVLGSSAKYSFLSKLWK